MDTIWAFVEEAAKHLPWWQAILLVLAVTLLGFAGKAGLAALKKLPVPPSGPVDNAPGSDGSSPDDEAGKRAAADGVASGKYRWLRDDPNTPPDPGGGGG